MAIDVSVQQCPGAGGAASATSPRLDTATRSPVMRSVTFPLGGRARPAGAGRRVARELAPAGLSGSATAPTAAQPVSCAAYTVISRGAGYPLPPPTRVTPLMTAADFPWLTTGAMRPTGTPWRSDQPEMLH